MTKLIFSGYPADKSVTELAAELRKGGWSFNSYTEQTAEDGTLTIEFNLTAESPISKAIACLESRKILSKPAVLADSFPRDEEFSIVIISQNLKLETSNF